MGKRQKKLKRAQRQKKIKIRLFPDEKAAIIKAAKAARRATAAWVRDVSVDAAREGLSYEGLRVTMQALNHLSEIRELLVSAGTARHFEARLVGLEALLLGKQP